MLKESITSQQSSKVIWFKFICLLWTLIFWSIATNAGAQDEPRYQLLLSPDKCVSLRQGQTCYVNIELQWSANISADYCIVASNQQAPLRCWDDAQSGQYQGEFSSDENTIFYLKIKEQTLAETELKMAWVYKRKRSSLSWRVF